MRKFLMIGLVLTSILFGCEAEGLEASKELLTDDLQKIQFVNNSLQITTTTELIIWDVKRDKVISRGDKYKLMKVQQGNETEGYILQVPKEEYDKFVAIYGDRLE